MLIWTIRRRGERVRDRSKQSQEAGERTGTEAEHPYREFKYLVHRHEDTGGVYLDLHIERPGGSVARWTMGVDILDRLSAGEEVVCTLNPEDSMRLAEQDISEYAMVDEGTYTDKGEGDGRRRLVFRGQVLDGEYEFRAVCDDSVVAALAEAVREEPDALLTPESVKEFIAAARDGRVARGRAVERLCGLGRELDGDAFDDRLWRRMLDGLSLTEIHRQTTGLERRFDEKYPPRSVSRSASLPEEHSDRRETVAAILEEYG